MHGQRNGNSALHGKPDPCMRRPRRCKPMFFHPIQHPINPRRPLNLQRLTLTQGHHKVVINPLPKGVLPNVSLLLRIGQRQRRGRSPSITQLSQVSQNRRSLFPAKPSMSEQSNPMWPQVFLNPRILFNQHLHRIQVAQHRERKNIRLSAMVDQNPSNLRLTRMRSCPQRRLPVPKSPVPSRFRQGRCVLQHRSNTINAPVRHRDNLLHRIRVMTRIQGVNRTRLRPLSQSSRGKEKGRRHQPDQPATRQTSFHFSTLPRTQSD